MARVRADLKSWRHHHKGVWGTAWESPMGTRWLPDPLTVGGLRAALEGLPDDMPVLAPIGCEGGDTEVECARVARAKHVPGGGCNAPFAVERDSSPGEFEDGCCGAPGEGDAFDVLWIGWSVSELIDHDKEAG